MLQQIREKFTGWIALLILGLIAVTFVFVGGANFTFFANNYAAEVDGMEISVAEFENAYRNQLQQNPSWAQLPDEFKTQIRRRILDLLIRERLVDRYLVEAGYQVSDEQVTAAIQRIAEFQVDGRFDLEKYRTVLLQNGFDPARFEAAQRQSMRENQLQRAIGATAIVTPADYRRYLNLVGEQRLVSLARFDIDAVAAGIEVSDEQVTAYYENNPTLFQTPESVDLEYIEIRRDAIARTIDVSEDELRQFYRENQGRFLQDEQRRARHILILADDDAEAAEAQARELLARIEAGESFEELAREYSADGGTAQQGGDLGVLTRTQLPGELGETVFSMQEGEVAGPLETDFGFHIVRLDRIVEQGPQPFEQVRGEILAELQQDRAEETFLELERDLSNAVFDSTDMQEIADSTGLELETATGFTRSGGEPFGANQAAIDAVFEDSVLNGGMISEVIELDANRSAIFKVTNRNPAARQPLAEVRDQVIAAVRDQEARNVVFDRATELMQALESGEDFATAAAAAGAQVTGPELVARQDPEIDQAVLFQVFMADKPGTDGPTIGQVANSDGGYTVYAVDAVVPGRPESVPVEQRDARKRQLTQQAGAAAYAAFVEALYQEARDDIKVNQDLVAASDLLQ